MPAHEVILVSQEGCNPCLRVKRILDEIRGEGEGFDLREVRLDSDEGSGLAVRHSIFFPPAVFVDGRLVGKGKVREEDLRRALGARCTPSLR